MNPSPALSRPHMGRRSLRRSNVYRQPQPARKVYTRLPEILSHLCAFTFQPQARLAKEVGVSRSTISRLINGKIRPSPTLVKKIQQVLDRKLGRPIPTREWLSPDTTWPTAAVCKVLGCPGCLPEQAYCADGSLKPAFRHIAPGTWTVEDIVQAGREEAA